jgi:hypothetical protein
MAGTERFPTGEHRGVCTRGGTPLRFVQDERQDIRGIVQYEKQDKGPPALSLAALVAVRPE